MDMNMLCVVSFSIFVFPGKMRNKVILFLRFFFSFECFILKIEYINSQSYFHCFKLQLKINLFLQNLINVDSKLIHLYN